MYIQIIATHFSSSAKVTPKPPKRDIGLHLSTASDSEDKGQDETSSYIPAGFSEEDLEKPHFPNVCGGPKVPLVLSEPGETPAVQVCTSLCFPV